MTFSIHSSILVFLSLSLLISSSTSLTSTSRFPNVWNYRFVNDPLKPLSTNGDYGSTYRCYDGPPHDEFQMSFCFFNTTPNAYTLALGTGLYPGNDPGGRWVWAANTNSPVRESAVVYLLPNGNLILYDVDGRVAWQSNTTPNMNDADWVSIRILNYMYGNLVLINQSSDEPFWQSFDHPQYSLFPNQLLHVSGAEVDKLVSYRSTLGGRYTMMMSVKSLDLYYKCATCPTPLKYYTLFKTTKALDTVTLSSVYQNNIPTLIQNFTDGSQGRFELPSLGNPVDRDLEFATMFLRIEMDGNLKIYFYAEDYSKTAFVVEGFKVFTKGGLASNEQESECQLPEKCGSYGVCDNDVCVACPSPNGLRPWTDKCMPPKLVGCSNGANATYYKIDGVEHFSSKYTPGTKPVTLSMCESKCSLDCKCLGYFYHPEKSTCWAISDLKTLTKSTNASHVGFIKMTA